MKARKVRNNSKVQVSTYFPSYFKGLLDFPGIRFENWDYDHWDRSSGKCTFTIVCPNEDVASEMGCFLRSYFDATGAVS